MAWINGAEEIWTRGISAVTWKKKKGGEGGVNLFLCPLLILVYKIRLFDTMLLPYFAYLLLI